MWLDICNNNEYGEIVGIKYLSQLTLFRVKTFIIFIFFSWLTFVYCEKWIPTNLKFNLKIKKKLFLMMMVNQTLMEKPWIYIVLRTYLSTSYMEGNSILA